MGARYLRRQVAILVSVVLTSMLIVGMATAGAAAAAPVFVDVQPADDTVTANANVVLTGTVTGAATLDIDGVSVTLVGDNFTTAAQALAEGTNNFVLTATDGGGVTAQLVHRIVRDSTAPLITIQQPIDGAVVPASPATVAGVASDAHLLSVTVAGITATLDGASFSAAVPLIEGSQTVTVLATDDVGNASQATVNVILDTVVPTLQITESGSALLDGTAFNRAVAPVVAATDANAVTLDLQLDGQPFVSGATVMAEGSHVLAALATDVAGNSANLTRTFTIDTTSPVLSGITPAAGTIVADAQATIAGQVTGATTVTVDGQAASINGSSFSAGPFTLVEGSRTFSVVATDAAGNSASVDRTIERDATVPVVVVTSPAAGTVVSATPITVSGSATDAHLVTVTVAGQVATLSGDTFSHAGLALVEGDNPFDVVATDAAGNETTTQVTVTLDTTAPLVTVSHAGAPLVDGTTFDGPVTPVIAASDDGSAASSVTVEATLDGLPFTSGTPVSTDGQHELVATATDTAGNPASISVTFTIDQVPPSIVDVDPPAGAVLSATTVTLTGRAPGAVGITVNGQAASLSGEAWSSLPLAMPAEGSVQFVIVATDAGGNSVTLNHSLVRDTTAPSIAIGAPLADQVTASTALTVSGTATDSHLEGVTVNGTVATISGSSWLAAQVPLAEGANTLTVEALDTAGNQAQATRDITRDTTDPMVAVTDPAPGTVVPDDRTTLHGTADDPHLDRVDVEGTSATLVGNSWSHEVILAEGANTFTVEAIDSVGNRASTTTSLVRDSQAPAVHIDQPAEGAAVQAESIQVAGTIDAEEGITVTVNGLDATVDTDTGTGTGTFVVDAVPLAPGTNRLTVRATDAQGNQGVHTRDIERDNTGPSFLASDPASGALAVSTTTSFRLTFDEPLAEPAAGAWRLEVAGVVTASTATLDGSALLVTPGTSLPSNSNIDLVLTNVLTDPAGNVLANAQTLSFTTADVGAPPAPELDPLPARLCGATVVVGGTAEPGATIVVAGGAGGVEGRADDDTGAFSLTVTLRSEVLNRLAVTASDAGGNASPVAIAEVVHDCTAPTVLAANRDADVITIEFSEAMAAGTIAAAVEVSDGALVLAGSVVVASGDTIATYTADAALPATVLLDVGTDATDIVGTGLAYPFATLLGAGGTGDSFLAGTAIDDATGRPLAGVLAVVSATDGAAPPVPAPAMTTGDDGRFLLAVPAGTHDLTLARLGYAPVFRSVTTTAGEGVDVFDGRLTPVGATASIDSAGASLLDPTGATLNVPAGAVGSTVAASLTGLEEQALPALLPYGWTPRGAVWVELGESVLTSAASLALPVDAADGTSLAIVSLDLGTLQWDVASIASVAGGQVTTDILATGAWAVVEADTGSTAPPSATPGAVLGSAPAPVGGEVVAALVTFDPDTVLATQTSHATVSYTVASPVPSGAPLTLIVEETLQLLDGTVRQGAPYRADLVLYRDAISGNEQSTFRLRPSEAARLLTIELGVEDVVLVAYGDETVRGNVLGPDGGIVVNDQGDELTVPAGALALPTAIVLTRRTAADLPLATPRGGVIDGVIEVDLGGTELASPGVLSLALGTPPAVGTQGLLLHVIEVDGAPAYRPVAALEATASGWSTATINPLDLAWPGVRAGGLYAFVRLTEDHAYLRGTAFDTEDAPLVGGIVSSTRVDWVQITGGGGGYVMPLPLGEATVDVLDPETGNTISIVLTPDTADGRIDLDPTVVIVGPYVDTITPADGAAGIPLGIEPTVRFSEPVDRGSLAGGIRLLDGSDPVAIEFDHQGSLVTILPQASLAPSRTYTLEVTNDVRDLQGYVLETPVLVTFTTQEVVVPDSVDETLIFLVEPDGQGTALIRGLAGAAPSGTLVFAENTSQFTATESVLAAADGSFELALTAALDDALILHVIIPGANEVILGLGPYMASDLRAAVVGTEAASFTTVDGFGVTLEAGTFLTTTRVRVTPTPIGNDPLPTPDGFEGVLGFDLDLDGAQPRRKLEVRLPVTNPTDDDYILVSSVELLGQRWWTLDDLLRVDGDVLTNAPPASPPDPQSLMLPPAGTEQTLQLDVVKAGETTFAAPVTARAISAEAIWAAKSAAQAMTVLPGAPASEQGEVGETAANSAASPLSPLSPLVKMDNHIPGSNITTGGVTRAARYRAWRAPQVHYFSMSLFGGSFAIFNIPYQFVAYNIAAVYVGLRQPQGLLPVIGGDAVVIEGWDISTGYRTFRQVLDPPAGNVEPLPTDAGNDHRAPYPVAGSPIRFMTLEPRSDSTISLATGMTATYGPVTTGSDPAMSLTVTGVAGSVSPNVELRLVGPRDGLEVRQTAGPDGAFTISNSVRPGNRYIMAVGGTMRQGEALTLRFSESLPEDHTGIELHDSAARSIPSTVDRGATPDEMTVKPSSGWQAGKTYRLRLTEDLVDDFGNAFLGTGRPDCDQNSANTCPSLVLDIEFRVAESTVLDTFDLSVARDIVRQGSLLFVAAGNDGMAVIDASNPTSLSNYLPGNLTWPLLDQVRGVAVDGHGRVIFVGGGASSFGQARIVDVQALGDVDPSDSNWRAGVVAGSTVLTDLPGGSGLGLQYGRPRRVSILSDDKSNDWLVGQPAPEGVTVTPAGAPTASQALTVTVTGADGVFGQPVTLRNLTRGTWKRVDAASDSTYSVAIEVFRGDRLEVVRNINAYAYITLDGDQTTDGLVIADINSFYRQDHGAASAPGVLRYVGGFNITTDQAADVFCDGTSTTEAGDYIDIAVVHDESDTAHEWTVLGLARSYGVWLMQPKANDLGDVSFLNGQCGVVGDVARMGGMAILLDYPMMLPDPDLPDTGQLVEQLRDYVVMTNVTGTVLVVDITDRTKISVVSTITLPGGISKVVADRAGRRLLISGLGAGVYVVDFDTLSNLPVDADSDGKDDRLLETIEIPGESVISPPLLIPELGLIYAGGTVQGVTGVAFGAPVMGLLSTNDEGKLLRARRLAPFGVPTVRDGNGSNTQERSGLVRVEARLPGFAAQTGDEVLVTLASVGPTGTIVQGTGLGAGTGPQPSHALLLRRQATNPWEEGYEIFVSDPVVLLADLRASIVVGMTPAEKAEDGLCRRCDLVAEGVYTTQSPPTAEQFKELLSGHRVAVNVSDTLRGHLEGVYDRDRIDAALAEAEAESVPWDISPALRQEPVQSPATGTGDVAPGTLLHSGEMTASAIDLMIAGRGLDVAFARSYRNQTLGNGPLGPGWDHGYRLRLRPLPDGDVEVFDGTGRRETYVKTADGYQRPPGRFWGLERRQSGWVITDARANTYHFDAFGRLVEIADALRVDPEHGNAVTFGYDAASQLARITDALDRDVVLRYNAKGLLTAVEDFSGRTFTYGYDGGRLKQFETPAVDVITITDTEPNATSTATPSAQKLVTTYAYAADAGSTSTRLRQRDNLVTLTDPKGNDWLTLQWFDEDGDGFADELTTQSWGGSPLSIVYNLPFGTGATVYDRRANACQYNTDSAGHPTRIEDATQAVWTFAYNLDGLVTSGTLPLGRTTVQTWQGDGSTTSGREGSNLLSVITTPDSRGPNGAPATLTNTIAYHAKTNQPVRVVDARGNVTTTVRDVTNGLAQSITRAVGTADASTTAFTYNDYGQLETVTNPNQHVTEHAYFATGASRGYLQKTVTDPGGLGITVRYETDVRGNATAIIDPRGVRHETKYNALDWRIEHTSATTASNDGVPALGFVSRWYYDKNSNVKWHEVPFHAGNEHTAVGYAHGQLDEVLQTAAQVEPEGSTWAVTSYAYDENRNRTEVTDPVGNIRKTEYDARNLPSKLTSGLGAQALADAIDEVPTYNAERALTSMQNGRGYVSQSTFDGYGRPMTQLDPLGNTTRTSYDANGNPSCEARVDASGTVLAVVGSAFDALDRLATSTRYLWRYDQANPVEACPETPDGVQTATTTYTYDPALNLLSTRDPLNRVTTMAYDAAERQVSITDAATNTTTLVLDAAGNAVEQQLNEMTADGSHKMVPSYASYDNLNRRTKQWDVLNNTTEFEIDARGLVRKVIDPTSQFTAYGYDGLNRRTAEQKPHGIATTIGYDLASRQTLYKDALGHKTAWSFDAVNRTTSVTYADVKTVSYGYDESHNLTAWTDQRGTAVTQAYDAANRPVSGTALPAAGDSLIGPTVETYGWDGLNRRTRVQSGSVVTELEWDSGSRLVSETTSGRRVAYNHDTVGNVIGTTFPSGFGVTRGFDSLNRVSTLMSAQDGSALAGYGYRGRGTLETKTVGSLVTEMTFDAARRPINVATRVPGGPPVLDESIVWGPRNLKSGIARNDRGGEGQIMAYDGAHRLLGSATVGQPLEFASPNAMVNLSTVTGQANHESFSYDTAMNQIASSRSEHGIATPHATPNDASGRNRPASVDGMALVWDDNGNLHQKGDLTMSYDFRNRLTTVEQAGNIVAEYRYDGFNRRVSSTVNGVAEDYSWDGMQQIETERGGSLVSQRVYGPGIDETVRFSRDTNSDGAIDSSYLTMFDSTNNLAVVTNLAGKPVERYEASAFGETRILVDSTPPAIEQARIFGDALWLEASEGVLGVALEQAVIDGTLRLHDTASGQDLTITVDQPVREGGQALRRIAITPDTVPGAGTLLELTVEPGVLVDSFANTTSSSYSLPFAWSATNTVISDSAAPEVSATIARQGIVEINFSEEVDPASSAITIDGAPALWTLSGDHYTLFADATLAPGSHTLAVSTAALDLAGSGLAEPFSVTFSVNANDAKLAYVAPDERETTVSTLGNDVGFHGRPVDPVTGLMYFRNRWLDPELGRFITPDPLGFVDGPSQYQFAGYSPANYSDPLGLNTFVIHYGPSEEDTDVYVAVRFMRTDQDEGMTSQAFADVQSRFVSNAERVWADLRPEILLMQSGSIEEANGWIRRSSTAPFVTDIDVYSYSGQTKRNKFYLADGISDAVLAHEFGHHLGIRDFYARFGERTKTGGVIVSVGPDVGTFGPRAAESIMGDLKVDRPHSEDLRDIWDPLTAPTELPQRTAPVHHVMVYGNDVSPAIAFYERVAAERGVDISHQLGLFRTKNHPRQRRLIARWIMNAVFR